MDAFSSSTEKLLDRFAVVDWGAIPNDQQFSRNFAHELLEKAHHIFSLVGVIL